MGAFSRLQDALRGEKRSVNDQYAIGLTSWDQYGSSWAQFGGLFAPGGYPIQLGFQQTLGGKQEEIVDSYAGYVGQAYRTNSIVFSIMRDRLALFSQVRFQWRKLSGPNGRPGNLFGTQALDIIEHPWPGGTTSDLLGRVIQSADLSGNAFIIKRSANRLAVLRPDWMTLILGSFSDPEVQAGDIDAELLGYVYHPGGHNSGRKMVVLDRQQVAHFAPIPDPLATYRGMSWLAPIIRETMADSAATTHKLKFFENGATPQTIVSLDPNLSIDAYNAWIDAFEPKHRGVMNAYKTMYMGAGAKADVVGANLQQIDFKLTQGAGETRIAAAGGIHPVIAGLSEGLAGSSLNSGNFAAARRLTADKTMRWLWQNMAGSLETIIPPPGGAQLWFDERDVAFLREDRKDAADIQAVKAQSIRTLLDAGYTAESVVKAIESEDMSLLTHSGLFSIQLQAPGSTKMPAGEVPGEVPVGPGTKPETLPAGDVSTKPTGPTGATSTTGGKP